MDAPKTILSPEEIIEITGYEQPSRQARWFRAQGTRAEINAKNRCIVKVTDWLNKQVETQRAPLATAVFRATPDAWRWQRSPHKVRRSNAGRVSRPAL